MDSTVELWILKGSPKENAADHLMGYKKARLFQLAELHQVAVKKNDTKAKIIDVLVPAILHHFADDMKHLKPLEKEQLHQIKAQRTDAVELREVQDLVEKGYLFVYLDKGQLNVVLPNDLLVVGNEAAEESEAETNMSKFATFFHNANTFEQIFGHINVDYLVTVWNRYYDRQLNNEEASRMLQEYNLSR